MKHEMISACLIIKDEAEGLADCLQSLRPYVLEIIVGDTGSSDESIAIARKFADRVIQIPWENDFAKARNQVLAHASQNWILSIDGDERLPRETGEKLQRLVLEADRECGGFDILNRVLLPNAADASKLGWKRWTTDLHQLLDPRFHGRVYGYQDHLSPRLFRNHPEIVWEGRLHETFVPSLERAGFRKDVSDLVWMHYCEFKGANRQLAKKAYYLKLSQQKALENPDSAIAQHELALEFTDQGHIEQAEKYIRLALALDPLWFEPHRSLGLLLLHQERFQEACFFLEMSFKKFPHESEIAIQLSTAYLHTAQWASASQIIKGLIQRGVQDYRVYVNAGLLFSHNGRKDLGRKFFQEALNLKPEDSYSKLALQELDS